MALFSDILKKIKKPVDALKDFLTPKERISIQEKENQSPLQRIESKSPTFEYKPPSFEGLKSFAASLVPPKEALKPIELAPKETPEQRAERLGIEPKPQYTPAEGKGTRSEKGQWIYKDGEWKPYSAILEFGKAVLRATPRAAASITLEAQGRRKMIPETKAEKFLFGEEPLESITERIERFPERAKEFGISESISKPIAPFAIVGLTALDLIPGIPKKKITETIAREGSETVIKNLLKTKVFKNIADDAAETLARTLAPIKDAKAVQKTLDEFVAASKTGKSAVGELKAAATAKSAVPKELESYVPQAQKHKNVESFIREISGDTYAPEFRNPIADFWRKKYIQPLSKGSKATFTTDVVAFERNLDDVLKSKYGKDQLANMSVQQKAEIVNGKKWADLYGDMLDNNLFKFQQDFFKAAKTTPAEIEEVPISSIKGVNRAKDMRRVGDPRIDKYRNIPTDKFPPVEVERLQDGTLKLYDGNARVNAALERGDKTIRVKIREAAPTTPTAALKEAAGKTIHSKKLETGIDEAYRALEKTGKDEVYNIGKVGDYIADPKVRDQYKEVLDTPLYIKKQMHMGKAHGSLSVDLKGNPAIVLSDGLTADMIDRTLVEELTHAKQFKKGIRPTKGVPYKEIPEEVRAKKAAKHFSPKTTLEDLMEEAGMHRAKAKQFSNNDLEKEFVARQLGVAEGIEKAIDNIKSAKPTDELKRILYHGTDFENVLKIQKGGFKTGGFLAHGYPQGVYFTTTKKEAQNYGKVIQSTTKLKLSEFFDVSKHKELNNLQGQKYIRKLNQIIREAAESKGMAIPEPTAKQLKQYTDLIGDLKDPLDISDIKTATLQKLGYRGFIAAEKGIGKEIVIFDPKDIVVGGKPSEALKAAVQKVPKEPREWIAKWIDPLKGEKIELPSVEAQNYLNQFKPSQSVKLYRGVPKDYVSAERAGLESWTYDKSVAEGFAGDGGKVLERAVNPEEIVIDFTKAPKGLTGEEFGKSAKEIKEVVVRPVQKAKVMRFSAPATINTDVSRGGTWYSSPESKSYDFTKIKGVGGQVKTEKEITLKNPLVMENVNLEDGSFAVINEGFENFLPAKERKLANELYERLHRGGGIMDKFAGTDEYAMRVDELISDIGLKLGMKEDEIGQLFLKNPNRFDALMDKIVSQGLKKEGYDSLIMTNVYKGKEIDRHVFKFAEAVQPSAVQELKAAAKAEIPKIKGAKVVEDLSKPAKVAQPSKIQEIIGEYQKRINTTPAKKAATPIRKTLDDTYTAIIDRFHPITKLARKASELRPGENPELLARRYLGVQGIAESKLFWNTTRLTAEGNLEVTGPGLSKVLRPAKDKIDDLRTLMIAERDIELSKRTLESGKKVVGTTPQKSKEVINALKQKHGTQGFEQLSKTAQGVREWSRKALLDPLIEVGAISKEQYDTIAKSNKFYVPFQRVIEELETHGFVPKKANIFSPKSVPVKKLKGSTRDIIDPFESMITNAYKITDFVERARVGKSITNLRNISPELAEMIKPIKPKIVPVAKQGEELIFRPSFFTPDKNTMMVFENGKRKFYQVPEDVFKAVSGMMESDVGAIMKVLAFPARTLRAGATLTPEFMGRNPFRDQFTAFVFSKYGYVPGVDLVKGIFNTVGKTDLHGRWLAGGGAHSMLVSLDRVTSQATLAKVLGAKDIKGMVKNPLEALRILSEFGEKGTRVGAFGRAVQKGVSDLEAAFESRDITLDFARRGSQTRAVNMLVAFWNAQVQGLNKLVRAFRERPMQTTFKAASGITLPSVLLYLNNRNDPRYQELPQWQKDLFWIIPVGDEGPIIRIPKPFEIGVIFGTVPEHILTWIDKNDPEALKSMAKTLMEASAPGYIPTGLQPIIENIANYSFFRQRPIVSEGKQVLPKELQAGRYTTETAKEIGKLIKQSPAKIENLFVGYTGGLGKYALDASDKLLKILGVVSPPSEPAKTLADRPFIRAFVAREPIGSGSESVNKFYKLYDEANATKAAVKGLAEEGKEQEAINYLRSHPAGFYTKGLNRVARSFSDLRKKRDTVLDSRELNPEQKKRAIDALDKIMTEIARQTVELVESSDEKLRQ